MVVSFSPETANIKHIFLNNRTVWFFDHFRLQNQNFPFISFFDQIAPTTEDVAFESKSLFHLKFHQISFYFESFSKMNFLLQAF